MKLRILPLAASIALLAGCASTPSSDTAASAPGAVDMASVALAPASGSMVSGKLMLMPMGDGVHVTGDIGGLAPNSTHGFHIHETGDCSAADASSAGGHFNPAGDAHGRASAPHHHLGDNDNLVADTNGVAHVDAHFAGAVLGGGGADDIVGKAVVVHANADDYTSQPSGNAGARIACGVITAP
ncbi:superoxide dismutase family protein [Pseudoluteimonas lycopersici]|uniref:Superoxide dismutase [Cu-Zn] n=1 Tax=Pseudoluteimonas lycopersici TaxID=1324796 RepID=A0A516V617_9GAMM|nr:superoxide dismutase family protein [Lysobacter lycopersici]QDQ73976.1 superoxide dismutase family protein [Lysobacter lycopersici]